MERGLPFAKMCALRTLTSKEIEHFMKTSRKSPTRKLGANPGEMARKQHKHDSNFSQSKDLREDRGARQIKTGTTGRWIVR
jgi:hypothetical protein